MFQEDLIYKNKWLAQFGLGALTHEDSFTILIPLVRIKLCFWEGLLVFEMKLLKVGHKGVSEGKYDDVSTENPGEWTALSSHFLGTVICTLWRGQTPWGGHPGRGRYLGLLGCVCGRPARGWHPPRQGTRFSAQPSCSHARQHPRHSSGLGAGSGAPGNRWRTCQTARARGVRA